MQTKEVAPPWSLSRTRVPTVLGFAAAALITMCAASKERMSSLFEEGHSDDIPASTQTVERRKHVPSVYIDDVSNGENLLGKALIFTHTEKGKRDRQIDAFLDFEPNGLILSLHGGTKKFRFTDTLKVPERRGFWINLRRELATNYLHDVTRQDGNMRLTPRNIFDGSECYVSLTDIPPVLFSLLESTEDQHLLHMTCTVHMGGLSWKTTQQIKLVREK